MASSFVADGCVIKRAVDEAGVDQNTDIVENKIPGSDGSLGSGKIKRDVMRSGIPERAVVTGHIDDGRAHETKTENRKKQWTDVALRKVVTRQGRRRKSSRRNCSWQKRFFLARLGISHHKPLSLKKVNIPICKYAVKMRPLMNHQKLFLTLVLMRSRIFEMHGVCLSFCESIYLSIYLLSSIPYLLCLRLAY